MKLSELIDKLQKIKEQHGDILVSKYIEAYDSPEAIYEPRVYLNGFYDDATEPEAVL